MFRKRSVSPEEAAYRRLAARDYAPATIIDVGAYEGGWSTMARRIWPSAAALLVEPQPAKRPLLERVVEKLGNAALVTALLADGEASVTFYEMETGSSFLPEKSDVERTPCTMQTQRLDAIAEHCPGPIFLKIDTQGAELKVLAGGRETLKRCSAVQLEVALLDYNEGAPSFLEVVSYMADAGFVPFDFSGFSRPNGQDLVQVDIIFVPAASPLRPNHFTFAKP